MVQQQCGTGEEGKTALEKTDTERSRHDSYNLPKSFEHEPASPLPPSDIHQMEQVQKLKEHVGSLVQAKVAPAAKVNQNSSDAQLPVKTQKILDEKNDIILKMREEIQAMKMTTNDLIDDESSSLLSAPVLKRSTLMEVQEQRTQQAFLENEAAERETERKLAKAKAKV